MTKIEYNSLYVLKAFAALAVLMVHFEFWRRQYFVPLFNCGVPIFYMISGFFLYCEFVDDKRRRIRNSMKKILKIAIFFNIVYFLLDFFVEGFMPLSNFKDIVRLFVYGDVISGHLWFLNSYFWVLLLFLLTSKIKNGDTFLLILSLLYFIIGLLERQYSFVFDFKKCFTRDYYIPSLYVSLPMMFLGYSFRKYEKIIENFIESRGALLNIVLLIAIIALYIEHKALSLFDHFSGGFMISTFFATPVFFLYCLKYRTYGKGSFLGKLGKNHSGNIYYWQFVPYFLFVRYIVTEFNLENVCLLIMIFTLIGWSYCINYIEKQILRRK